MCSEIKQVRSPSRKARGDRDFKAGSKIRSEERYPATQRTSKERKAQAGARGDRDFKAGSKIRSEERYPATQRQQSIVAYVDSTGAVSAEYEYDPFGKVIAHTGRDFDFLFSTKFYDPDIGMYYYGYRYYSPELRRWASPDPIGEAGGLNLYGFCGNDALSKIDLYGMKIVWVGDPNKEYGIPGDYIAIAGKAGIVFSIVWEGEAFDCCDILKEKEEIGPVFFKNERFNSYYPIFNTETININEKIIGTTLSTMTANEKGKIAMTMHWSNDFSGVNSQKFRKGYKPNMWNDYYETWNIRAHYPWTEKAFFPFEDDGTVIQKNASRSGIIEIAISWNDCLKENRKVSGTENGRPITVIIPPRKNEKERR